MLCWLIGSLVDKWVGSTFIPASTTLLLLQQEIKGRKGGFQNLSERAARSEQLERGATAPRRRTCSAKLGRLPSPRRSQVKARVLGSLPPSTSAVKEAAYAWIARGVKCSVTYLRG
jgi:hypothetical protein